MQKEILKDLLNVVKGITPPDCIVRNGRIVNVFTNAIEENLIIAIKNGFIASIEKDEGNSPYGNAPTVDAEGLYLCPGFIDAHTHIDNTHTFHALVPYAVRGGTTSIITELGTLSCAAGIEGVKVFIDSTKGYPLRCYFVVPPHTPPFPSMERSLGIPYKEFSKLLKREDFVGIGEAYWMRALNGEDRLLKQSELAMSLNKRLDGHAAGARGKRLVEYILTGITSCHESVNIDEAIEKLRYGIYVMIREGFVRRELPELARLKDHNVDKRRIMLVSDSFDPVMLCEEGYLDAVVRTAIRRGFTPMDAIKMTTINPADYYGLRHLGAIAPLRYADILFLKDLEDVTIERVMVNGEIAFEGGRFLKDIKPYEYPAHIRHTISAEKCAEEDFKVKADPNHPEIRVIDVVNQTITREARHRPSVEGGYLQKDLVNDIIPVAVINKKNSKQRGKGFIKGTGIKNGAIATTLIWDTTNIFVIGSNEKDMALAVNRIIDIQGGTIIVRGGEIIYEFPMPLFGIVSNDTIENIRYKIKELETKIREIGASLDKPFLNIQTIPFTGLPFLRITDKGLADIKTKKLVPLFVE